MSGAYGPKSDVRRPASGSGVPEAARAVGLDELSEHIRSVVPAMLPGIAERIAESLLPFVAAAVDAERATTGRRIEAAVDVAVSSWLDDQWVRVLGPEERLQGVLAVERAVRAALASPGEES